MKIFKTYHCLIFIILFLTLPVQAQDNQEETVTIRNEKGNTFYEYKLNGKLVEIKVVPKKGKPYYLIPNPNDGDNFMRREQPRISAPSWILFRW